MKISPGRHSRKSGNPEDGYRLPQGRPLVTLGASLVTLGASLVTLGASLVTPGASLVTPAKAGV